MSALPSPAGDPSSCLLWFDTEFNVSEVEHASILQAALVVTDSSLRVLQPLATLPLEAHERRKHGVCLHVAMRPGLPLSDFVRAQTELLAGCEAHGRPIAVVDRLLCAWVDATLGPPDDDKKRRPMLAGNSIHMDWYLVLKELPELARRLHYRVLDVTALKTEWRTTLDGPKFDKDDPASVRAHLADPDVDAGAARHDAYYDVQASMAELAFYRKAWRRAT
jgi:oligoribonuclease